MSRDSWGTPLKLFRWVQSQYPVDVDICASNTNHLLPVYFTEENSCLDKDWSEYTESYCVYCNPPYSNPMPFVEKAVEQAKLGVVTVMLVNLDPSTKWFKLALTACCRVIPLVGSRVQFVPPEGITASTNPKPQCLLIINGSGNPVTEWLDYKEITNEYE